MQAYFVAVHHFRCNTLRIGRAYWFDEGRIFSRLQRVAKAVCRVMDVRVYDTMNLAICVELPRSGSNAPISMKRTL